MARPRLPGAATAWGSIGRNSATVSVVDRRTDQGVSEGHARPVIDDQLVQLAEVERGGPQFEGCGGLTQDVGLARTVCRDQQEQVLRGRGMSLGTREERPLQPVCQWQ